MAGTDKMHAIADRWGRLRNFDVCSETEPTQTWPYMIWINPTSQEIKVRNKTDTAWVAIGGAGGGDEKVKVTADDTTAGYLLPKLDAGTGIQLTELNPGGNEQVQITSTVSLDDAYNAGRIITADAGAVEIQGAGGLLSQGNVILDDGAGDSPQLQLVGGTHDDTALIFLDDAPTLGSSDIVIRCAGATGDFIVQNSAGTPRLRLHSTGVELDESYLEITRSLGSPVYAAIRQTPTNNEIYEVATFEVEPTSGAGTTGFGGKLTFKIDNTAGSRVNTAAIAGAWDVATSGSEDGRLEFQVRIGGGALAEVGRINKDGLTMAAGKDITMADDTWIGLGAAKGRIEFNDAATDEINFQDCYVGIGQSPSYKLDMGPATQCARLGRALVGEWPAWSDVAFFGHQGLTQTATGNYALIQDVSGYTSLNAVSGQTIYFRENHVTKMQLSGGQLGVATAPSQTLHIGGTIRANNLLGGATNVTCNASGDLIRDPSDISLKKDIRDVEGALDKVLQLRGVTFAWKEEAEMGAGRDYGLIAQEVEAIVPELISLGDNGLLSVKYNWMTALLVEAVKEQQKQIAALSTA